MSSWCPHIAVYRDVWDKWCHPSKGTPANKIIESAHPSQSGEPKEDSIEDLEVHVYKTNKVGAVKSEFHGYLCGDSIDKIEAHTQRQVIAELERFNTNGAIIHDCGKRVDGVVHTARIRERIAELRGKLWVIFVKLAEVLGTWYTLYLKSAQGV